MSEISEKKHAEVIQILGDGRYRLKLGLRVTNLD